MQPKLTRMALISLTGLGLALGSVAPAQTPAPVAGKATLGVTVVQAEAVATGWRASKMIHATVYNDGGEKIGKVDDLIVAPDGSLSTAIVDVGGFLGVAARRVAIPIQQFKQFSPKAILPGATKDALKNLPEFEYAKA